MNFEINDCEETLTYYIVDLAKINWINVFDWVSQFFNNIIRIFIN